MRLNDTNPRHTVSRVCQQCATAFLADPLEVKRGKALFCSHRCANLARWAAKPHTPALVERQCGYCAQPFAARPYEVRRGKAKYCSPTCQAKGKTRPAAERLWSNVDRSGGPSACWPWTGPVNGSGYGSLEVGSRQDGTRRIIGAHVMAYELAYGPLAPGYEACHNCPDGDWPRCCNPSHLFAGTQTDNMRDSVAKGRHRNQFTVHRL